MCVCVWARAVFLTTFTFSRCVSLQDARVLRFRKAAKHDDTVEIDGVSEKVVFQGYGSLRQWKKLQLDGRIETIVKRLLLPLTMTGANEKRFSDRLATKDREAVADEAAGAAELSTNSSSSTSTTRTRTNKHKPKQKTIKKKGGGGGGGGGRGGGAVEEEGHGGGGKRSSHHQGSDDVSVISTRGSDGSDFGLSFFVAMPLSSLAVLIPPIPSISPLIENI